MACAGEKGDDAADRAHEAVVKGVVAVTVGGDLVAIADGSDEVSIVSAANGSYEAVAPVLEYNAERNEIFLLTPFVGYDAAQQLQVRDGTSLDLKRSIDLPVGDGLIARILSVAEDGTRALVVGNRGGTEVVLLELSLADDSRSSFVYTPTGVERNWTVLWATAAPALDRVYVSFHGAGTTGSDVLVKQADSWELACPPHFSSAPPVEGSACIPNHGAAMERDGFVYFAQGSRFVGRLATDGASLEIDTGLEGHHLMIFDVLADGRVVAVGSCGYVAGVQVASVESEPRQVSKTVCGEAIALSAAGERVAVGRNVAPVPQPVGSGTVELVDLASGASTAISVPGEVIDLVWVEP
jgi:hypothetical protein